MSPMRPRCDRGATAARHSRTTQTSGDTGYRRSPQYHPNMLFLGPDARPGQPFAGPYFPVMWPRDRTVQPPTASGPAY